MVKTKRRYIICHGRILLLLQQLLIVLIFDFLWMGGVARAYQNQVLFEIQNPEKVLLEAEKIPGFKPTVLETSAKADLIDKHIRKDGKREFYNLYFSDTPSELNKSWIYEVEEAFKERPRLFNLENAKLPHIYNRVMKDSTIEKAKMIAKKEMFDQVLKHWSCVKLSCISQTVYNKDGLPDDPQHMPEVREFVIHTFTDSFNFVPKNPYARQSYFLFHVEDLGFVEIEKKTLKKGRVIFEIGTQYKNELEPHADEIKADDDPALHPGEIRIPKSKKSDESKSKSDQETTAPISPPVDVPVPPPLNPSDEDF